MKTSLRALALALACACLPSLGADKVEGSTVPLFDAKDPVISRRIMLRVTNPADTLPPLNAFNGRIQGQPGASPGANALGVVLGTLLIKGMNESNERAAREFSSGLEQALSEIDMSRELAAELGKELERTGYMKGASLEEVSDPSDLEQPGLLVRITERDIFTLDARYVFDSRFTSLHLLTTVRLWRKDDTKPLYTARLHYVSRRVDEGGAKRQWIADDGAMLTAFLREAAVETAGMFVADAALRAIGNVVPNDTVQASWVAAETGKTVSSELTLLMKGESRIWGRAKSAQGEETISLPMENATILEESASR
jgi:hypothetical protein